MDTTYTNPKIERMLLEYPLTKESLQLEQSLSDDGNTKSIFYTRWLYEFKKPSVKQEMFGQSLSFIPSPEEPPFLVGGIGYMNGEVKDSFEIYGDKTIHPEVPDEYISGICESGIRNIHHEGCLKEWSKLYGTKLKEKHISDIHFNSFIYNMGDPFSKQFFYRSVGYELSQEDLSVDLDSFKLQFLKEEEISNMSGNFTLN